MIALISMESQMLSLKSQRRLLLAFSLSGVIFLSGCGRETSTTDSKSKGEMTPSSPPTANEPKSDVVQFDLGGPCLPIGSGKKLALTGAEEEQIRANRQWQRLVDGEKENVRGDCSIPYRWERLFGALVQADRYSEAVQVLAEMEERGFSMPHAVVSKSGEGFLSSKEFKGSYQGAEYAARETEIRKNLISAENQLASMTDNDRPPQMYRHSGACPFECCMYRQWKTRSAVELLESIGSSRIVAQVPSGASVKGLTGEVRLEPEPYVVLEDNGVLKAGEAIFFLDNIGEGHVNYWYHGRLNPDLQLEEGLLFYSYEDCNSNFAKAKAGCSLRKLRPERTYRNEWWVKVSYGGKEGWVLNTGQFDNVDACG